MAEATQKARTVVPACNICEENGAMVLRLEMPGVTRDRISVNVDGDVLTVTGERPELPSGDFLIRERRLGDYRASYTLDERIDRSKIDAKMDRGVLTLSLHLKDEVKPRKIAIKAE